MGCWMKNQMNEWVNEVMEAKTRKGKLRQNLAGKRKSLKILKSRETWPELCLRNTSVVATGNVEGREGRNWNKWDQLQQPREKLVQWAYDEMMEVRRKVLRKLLQRKEWLDGNCEKKVTSQFWTHGAAKDKLWRISLLDRTQAHI